MKIQIKNKLDNCRSLIERLSSREKPTDRTTRMIQELKEKEISLMEADTYIIKTKGGDTEAIQADTPNVNSLKKDPNITGIKSTKGQKIKEQETEEEEQPKGIEYTQEETKVLAKEVAKALVKSLRSVGDEVERGAIQKIEPNTFNIFIQYKSEFEDTFQFIVEDNKLFMKDEISNIELGEIGIKPSGEAIIHQEIVQNNLLKHFNSAQKPFTVDELNSLAEQAYIEVLKEAGEPSPENPVGDPRANSQTILPDATDEMLEKFPTLKKSLERLMTRDFKEFVEKIDWISPRPTAFRISLQNGQDFNLKWMGKNFEAKIGGKRYFLGKIDEFQQALDKLSVLYQESPLGATEEEPGEGFEDQFNEPGGISPSTRGGGMGNFPGSEPNPEAAFENPPQGKFPEKEESEEESKDLGGENISFETGEEPR